MSTKYSLPLLAAPLAIAIGLSAAAMPLHAAQNESARSGAECTDNATPDRKSRRRRAGGSNRDCGYTETKIDKATGEVVKVVVADEESAPKAVRERVYRNTPRPTAQDYVESIPIPDRWRIVDSLGYEENWWDPYNRNLIKGDKPIYKEDWFLSVIAISDTVIEKRGVPTPVGLQSTRNPGQLDLFGGEDQYLFNENLAVELAYYKGDTVFKPPEWEYRFTPVFNYNYTRLDEILGVNVAPEEQRTRYDNHVGIQSLFVDKHLRDTSSRYDFDSVRVGIQPFSSDFRGFLYQDAPFGVRFFGNKQNNIFQYNLAWFRRFEKDTNSGLNDYELRDDDIFVANLFWQDFMKLGFMSQWSLIYNRNRESDSTFFDNNKFIQRPASLGVERLRDYDVTYLGYNGDGHFDRFNLTVSAYLALGEEDGAVFTDRESDIEAYFFAAEGSMDFDWIRPRVSFLYASGDDDPFDDKSEGFDAILENPQFAGADTSYWIRNGQPLIGGGRVALSQRNGVLTSLESSKEHGQSNFTNPGVLLIGAGVDMDLTPELRLSFNANYLEFAETEVLKVARQQANVDKEIGLDLSAAIIYRPLMSQNIVVRLSYAKLEAGDGYKDLFEDNDPYTVLFNLILTY